MKNKKITIILGIILVISIGIGGKVYMDKKNFNDEMLKVVKSDEAKQVFEEGLRNLDSKALTPEGVIKSYEIDYESVKHNPMGGIDVTILANNNADLYIFYNLNKDSDGHLSDSGGGNSATLENLLEEQ